MVRNIVYYIHMFCISRSGRKKKVSDYYEDQCLLEISSRFKRN